MAITLSKLVKLRDTTAQQSQNPQLLPELRAWNSGHHDELTKFIPSIAQGDIVERVDLQAELDSLKARELEPWNVEHGAYWSGCVVATTWLLSNWADRLPAAAAVVG